MSAIRYPKDRIVKVTEETLITTPATFYRNGGIYEFASVDYFSTLIEKNGSKGVFLDIGAQSGLYSLLGNFYPNILIHSFEPYGPNIKCLNDNLQLNNITNVITYKFALGEKNDKLKLKIPPNHNGLITLGSNPLRFDKWTEEEVDVKRIDDLFADTPINFIKIDTEGWEYYILKGGIKTITKWKPEIFLEINETNMRQANVELKQLQKLLQDLGYSLVTCIDIENYHYTPNKH